MALTGDISSISHSLSLFLPFFFFFEIKFTNVEACQVFRSERDIKIFQLLSFCNYGTKAY